MKFFRLYLTVVLGLSFFLSTMFQHSLAAESASMCRLESLRVELPAGWQRTELVDVATGIRGCQYLRFGDGKQIELHGVIRLKSISKGLEEYQEVPYNKIVEKGLEELEEMNIEVTPLKKGNVPISESSGMKDGMLFSWQGVVVQDDGKSTVDAGDQEIWFLLFHGAEAYYFFMLISPSSEVESDIWQSNLQDFKSILSF